MTDFDLDETKSDDSKKAKIKMEHGLYVYIKDGVSGTGVAPDEAKLDWIYRTLE